MSLDTPLFNTITIIPIAKRRLKYSAVSVLALLVNSLGCGPQKYIVRGEVKQTIAADNAPDDARYDSQKSIERNDATLVQDELFENSPNDGQEDLKLISPFSGWDLPVQKTGNHRIVIGLAEIGGLKPNYSNTQIHQVMNEVSKEFKKQSWNKLNIEVAGIIRDLRVDSADASCSSPNLAARDSLKSATESLGLAYEALMVIVPRQNLNCPGGWAYVGGKDIWITVFNFDVVTHELQHHLGIQHSEEYHGPALANLYTGIGDGMHELSVPQKIKVGWITSDDIAEVRKSGTYSLSLSHIDPASTTLPKMFRVATNQNNAEYLVSASFDRGVRIHALQPNPSTGNRYGLSRTLLLGTSKNSLAFHGNVYDERGLNGFPLTIRLLSMDPRTAKIHIGFSSQVSWQNPLNPYDVNNDSRVTAADANAVLNDISKYGSRALSEPRPASAKYIDVSGNMLVSSLDANLLINQIPKEIFRDAFNRSTSAYNGFWHAQQLGLGILNGRLIANDAPSAEMSVATLRKDSVQSIYYDVLNVNRAKVGLVSRLDDAGNKYLFLLDFDGNVTTAELWRLINGKRFRLNQTRPSIARKGTVELSTLGSQLIARVNGTNVLSAIDFQLAFGKPGVWVEGKGIALDDYTLK